MYEGNKNVPNRVIYNDKGDVASKLLVLENHKIKPSIIFFRNDGWSLGAPKEFEEMAYKMYEDEWVRYARSPQFFPKNMNDYERVK